MEYEGIKDYTWVEKVQYAKDNIKELLISNETKEQKIETLKIWSNSAKRNISNALNDRGFGREELRCFTEIQNITLNTLKELGYIEKRKYRRF